MIRRKSAIWLLLALLTIAQLNAIEPVPTEDRAKALIKMRQFERARTVYSQLLARTPGNVEYSIWIGRLSGYLADYPAAVNAYRTVLAKSPSNVEALVGYAYILLWMKNYKDAGTMLTRAKTLLPSSSDVEIALARKSFYENNHNQAQQHAELALQLDSQNQDARDFSDRLNSLHPTRYTLHSGQDLFSFGAPFRQLSLAASHRFGSMNAGLSVQDWSRFGRHMTRVGFDFSRDLSKNMLLEGASYFGSRGDLVARRDHTLALSRKLNGRVLASLGYRNLAFDNAGVNIFLPSLTYRFSEGSWLRGSINRSWTSYGDGAGHSLPANAYSLLYGQRLSRRTSLTTGFSAGNEFFPALISQRPGVYSAQTYSGSVRFPLSHASSMSVEYSYQRRSSGVWQQSIGTSIVVDK